MKRSSSSSVGVNDNRRRPSGVGVGGLLSFRRGGSGGNGSGRRVNGGRGSGGGGWGGGDNIQPIPDDHRNQIRPSNTGLSSSYYGILVVLALVMLLGLTPLPTYYYDPKTRHYYYTMNDRSLLHHLRQQLEVQVEIQQDLPTTLLSSTKSSSSLPPLSASLEVSEGGVDLLHPMEIYDTLEIVSGDEDTTEHDDDMIQHFPEEHKSIITTTLGN